MLTLQDCVEMSDVDLDELFAIAHHEHLPDIVALEKVQMFLQQDWGPPAVRQMILDEVRGGLEDGDCKRTVEALKLLEKAVRTHPGGHDRRLQRENDKATH